MVEFSTIMEMKTDEHIPKVNMEVWIAPEARERFPVGILQGGSLSNDLWRYGLFVVESFDAKNYSYKDFMGNDRATYTKNRQTIEEFKVSESMRQTLDKELERVNGTHHQCNSTTEPCATVITSYHNETKFLIDHAKVLGLKLEIYFFEENLAVVLKNLVNVKKISKSEKKKFLVFHWTPSEIIDGNIKFKSVAMPNCELYKTEQNRCRYEFTAVTPYFNQRAEDSEDLMVILEYMRFTSLKPLIALYNKGDIAIDIIKNHPYSAITIEDHYNNVACKWIQENKHIYDVSSNESWIKKSDDLREISIGGM